jgi:hypothetical protein
MTKLRHVNLRHIRRRFAIKIKFMANYLTVKQAASTTRKSERQIRRLCYDDKSKDFVTHDEKGRLLVDANYLSQHYALIVTPLTNNSGKSDNGKSIDKPLPVTIDISQVQQPDNLLIKVALLEQEVRQKNEIISLITSEKDKRIEVLERTLLLLGEGTQSKESKKRWWQF